MMDKKQRSQHNEAIVWLGELSAHGTRATMSRSKRKTPIFGVTTAESERSDKQRWHKKLRRKVVSELRQIDETATDGINLPTAKEVSNPWKMGKDGKLWWGEATGRDLRK